MESSCETLICRSHFHALFTQGRISRIPCPHTKAPFSSAAGGAADGRDCRPAQARVKARGARCGAWAHPRLRLPRGAAHEHPAGARTPSAPAPRGLSCTKRSVRPDACARASPSGHLSCYTLWPSLEPRLLCAGWQPRDHSHKTAASRPTDAGLRQTRRTLSATPHAHGARVHAGLRAPTLRDNCARTLPGPGSAVCLVNTTATSGKQHGTVHRFSETRPRPPGGHQEHNAERSRLSVRTLTKAHPRGIRTGYAPEGPGTVTAHVGLARTEGTGFCSTPRQTSARTGVRHSRAQSRGRRAGGKGQKRSLRTPGPVGQLHPDTDRLYLGVFSGESLKGLFVIDVQSTLGVLRRRLTVAVSRGQKRRRHAWTQALSMPLPSRPPGWKAAHTGDS